VLLSEKDGNFYTGYTSELKQKLEQHNSGKVTSTKLRMPLKLVILKAV
jgi:putative endonuclease